MSHQTADRILNFLFTSFMVTVAAAFVFLIVDGHNTRTFKIKCVEHCAPAAMKEGATYPPAKACACKSLEQPVAILEGE